MEVRRIAIVGLGSIGRRHLRILKEMRPDIEVTLVRSGSGLDWPEVELAKRTVHSLDEALGEGIQAAIISSPATVHLSQAGELAKAGIHLLIEKPLSHSLEGVDEFLNEASTKGITGLIGYVLRYDPAARKFAQMLQVGLLGNLLHARVECGSYLPDWRPDQDYRTSVSARPELGGGVLLELCHELDYIRWFFGEMISVYAHLHNSGTLEIDVQESGELILTNGYGLPISVHLDFHRRHPSRCCSVQGIEGELTWEAIQKQVIWHPAGGEPQVETFDFDRDHIYREQLQHFLDCIENGTPTVVSLEDGAAAVRLVDAALQSHESGQRMQLS